MSDTITTIEASMRADADALRVIAQNIANAEVTAYRRQVPLGRAEFAPLVDALSPPAVREQAAARSGATAFDNRPGTLKATGQSLDVAIEGSGFLVLQSAAGQLLTRRGDLHVSAEGLLSAAAGAAVLGMNGPIQIGAAMPAIDSDGMVRVGAEVIDQLQIVHVADETELQYAGDGLYVSPQGDAAIGEGYSSVRQGFLETSNVAPVGEMVQMMETLRHFEAAQRLVRGYDQMMEKAISELGKAG